MQNDIIKIKNLSFGYKKGELVLNGLEMNIPNGSIYGFLGSNGAGKTTTLKLILSLLNSYAGSILFRGKSITSAYPSYLQSIGSLIENPSFYGHLSARQNLILWSKYFKQKNNEVDQILEMVGLAHVGKKRTIDFSTGMKQRLGIATALLHDPQLLILDEPTNGLDPIAVQELRKMLNILQDRGKTILISSHILSEIEKMVSHIGIISQGSLQFEGTKDELLNQKRKNVEIQIHVDNVPRSMQILQNLEIKRSDKNDLIVTAEHIDDVPKIIKQLVDGGVNIYEVKKREHDLESMFLSYSNNFKN